MGTSFWVVIGVICVVSIIVNGVTKIIRVSKSGGGKESAKRFDALSADLAAIEEDLQHAQERIEVLEKIVTDEKYDLNKKIDDLAG